MSLDSTHPQNFHQRIRWTEWPPRLRDDCHPAIELRGCPGSAERLRAKTVLAAGLGAVNGPACESLVRMGIGTLIAVDPDRYDEFSRHTQSCLANDDGRFKADVIGERLHHVNPDTRIVAGVGQIQDVPSALIARADVLLSGGDNLEMLAWLGRMAAQFAKPLVQAAVDGDSRTACTRVWNLVREEAPCPACEFNQADWSKLQSREGCGLHMLRSLGAVSTRSLPNVCATAGQMASMEVLKLLLGESDIESGAEFINCLWTHQTLQTRLSRREGCRSPHRRSELVEIAGHWTQVTPRQLLGHAGNDPRAEIAGEIPWCSFTHCGSCGAAREVLRFARPGETVDTCCCGQPLTARPVGSRGVIPRADLSRRLDRPLTDLGLDASLGVGIAAVDRRFWFISAFGADAILSPPNVHPKD